MECMSVPATLLPLGFINSAWEWLVILFIALLLFGSRLPNVARNMGKGINEFKKGLSEGNGEGGDGPPPPRDRDTARTPAGAARRTEIDDTSV